MEIKEKKLMVINKEFMSYIFVGILFVLMLITIHNSYRKNNALAQKINEQEKIANTLDSFSRSLSKSVNSLNNSVDSLVIKSNKMKDATNELLDSIDKLESLNK